jgi:hypothetical protein
MTDNRLHSNILDERCFRGAECDTGHYLVVEKVKRERLSASKRAAQKFDVDRFNVSKINDMVLQCSIRLKSQIGLQLWRIG